jgi:hypothetical protein
MGMSNPPTTVWEFSTENRSHRMYFHLERKREMVWIFGHRDLSANWQSVFGYEGSWGGTPHLFQIAYDLRDVDEKKASREMWRTCSRQFGRQPLTIPVDEFISMLIVLRETDYILDLTPSRKVGR